MILGLPGGGECFREIDDAVKKLTNKTVVFNAHMGTAPEGAVIYSMENLGSRPDWKIQSKTHEIWEFSKTNLPFYAPEECLKFGGIKHVPIGYHPSMERFSRAPKYDIDIAFAGAHNERRIQLFRELKRRGFRVELIPPERGFGPLRDAVLAKTRLAINVHYYTSPSLFEALRVAHLISNKVPVLTEESPVPPDCEIPEEQEWGLTGYPYEDLADVAEEWLTSSHIDLDENALSLFDKFKTRPMTCPQ